MARSKLVSNLWNSLRPHLHLNKSLALLIDCEEHLVNLATLRVLELDWTVFLSLLKEDLIHLLLLLCWLLLRKRIIKLHWGTFADDHIISTNLVSRTYKTINVKLVVSSMLSTRALLEVWDLKLFLFLLAFTVCSKETASKQASVNTWLVEDDWIFLVVASVASYSNYSITSRW